VGTNYGLAVFDDSAWTAYFMHNSELRDNDITSVAVAGSFDSLPAAQDKPSGSLTAKILEVGGAPIANAPIEICVLTLGDTYYGDTPRWTSPSSPNRRMRRAISRSRIYRPAITSSPSTPAAPGAACRRVGLFPSG
jgi:hypothetical protein